MTLTSLHTFILIHFLLIWSKAEGKQTLFEDQAGTGVGEYLLIVCLDVYQLFQNLGMIQISPFTVQIRCTIIFQDVYYNYLK